MLIHKRRVGQHIVDGELQRQKDRLWNMHLWIVFRKINPVVGNHDADEDGPNHKARDENTLTDDQLPSLLLQIAVKVLLDYIDEQDEHNDTHDTCDGEERQRKPVVSW